LKALYRGGGRTIDAGSNQTTCLATILFRECLNLIRNGDDSIDVLEASSNFPYRNFWIFIAMHVEIAGQKNGEKLSIC